MICEPANQAIYRYWAFKGCKNFAERAWQTDRLLDGWSKTNSELLTPYPQPLTPPRPKQQDCDQHATMLEKSTCDIHKTNLASEHYGFQAFHPPPQTLLLSRVDQR